MKIGILTQLINGYHLEPKELKDAQKIVNRLQAEIDNRKPREMEFTRINNDVNGNPRYVVHFLNLADNYEDAIKLGNSIGGKKYHTKNYGGGIVFQSYNTHNLQKRIEEIATNR